MWLNSLINLAWRIRPWAVVALLNISFNYYIIIIYINAWKIRNLPFCSLSLAFLLRGKINFGLFLHFLSFFLLHFLSRTNFLVFWGIFFLGWKISARIFFSFRFSFLLFFFFFSTRRLANYASFLVTTTISLPFFDIWSKSFFFFSRLTLSPYFYFHFLPNLMLYFVKRELFPGNFSWFWLCVLRWLWSSRQFWEKSLGYFVNWFQVWFYLSVVQSMPPLQF